MMMEDNGDRALPDGTCPREPNPAVSAVPASVPNAGARSLRSLGIDHYYAAENWDATYEAGDTEYASDWLVEEHGYGRGVCEVSTLIQGPTLYAGHYPIGWVEGSDPGDIDDWEVRFFESRDQWQRAVAQAIEARRAETQGGSVHESAVADGHAPHPHQDTPHE